MGHARGQIGQAFDPAEAFGEREQAQALEQSNRGLGAAPRHEGDDAAESPHLHRGQRMLRMAGKARVEHALDLGVFCQPFGDGESILAMGAHAQREGFQPSQRQSCRKALGSRPPRFAGKQGARRARHPPRPPRHLPPGRNGRRDTWSRSGRRCAHRGRAGAEASARRRCCPRRAAGRGGVRVRRALPAARA